MAKLPRLGGCNRVGCHQPGKPRAHLRGLYCDQHYEEGCRKLEQAMRPRSDAGTRSPSLLQRYYYGDDGPDPLRPEDQP